MLILKPICYVGVQFFKAHCHFKSQVFTNNSNNKKQVYFQQHSLSKSPTIPQQISLNNTYTTTTLDRVQFFNKYTSIQPTKTEILTSWKHSSLLPPNHPPYNFKKSLAVRKRILTSPVLLTPLRPQVQIPLDIKLLKT